MNHNPLPAPLWMGVEGGGEEFFLNYFLNTRTHTQRKPTKQEVERGGGGGGGERGFMCIVEDFSGINADDKL